LALRDDAAKSVEEIQWIDFERESRNGNKGIAVAMADKSGNG
jgi:hypothetical protein